MHGLLDSGLMMLMALTVVAVLLVVLVLRGLGMLRRKVGAEGLGRLTFLIRQLGVLAAVLGVLGQGVGLYLAMRVIEQTQQGIAPQLLWQGVARSMVTTLYGLGILALALVCSLWITHRQESKSASSAS